MKINGILYKYLIIIFDVNETDDILKSIKLASHDELNIININNNKSIVFTSYFKYDELKTYFSDDNNKFMIISLSNDSKINYVDNTVDLKNLTKKEKEEILDNILSKGTDNITLKDKNILDSIDWNF